jgi:hypothetical protein
VRRSPRRRPSSGARRLAGGAVIVAVMTFVLAALPALASAAGLPMCHRRYAHDYAAPLAQMPPAHALPEGELPFGPRNLSVHTIGTTHVVLSGSRLGFRFAGKNAPHRVIELGWRVKATAWAVDADGHTLRRLGSTGWHVDRIRDLDKLQLAFPATRPGFVRVDVRVATLAGRSLGSYRDYFRVLKRTNEVRIATDRPSVRPGETIVGLLENPGAGEIDTKRALTVERLAAGTWEVVPQPPSPLSIKDWSWLIAPGEVSRCNRFDVPVDAAPGRYRFAAKVNEANTRKKVTVTGGFEVTP